MVTLAQNDASVSEFVFGREKELEELRRRLSTRESFVLHGPSGAGKTFLLHQVLRTLPNALYCPDSPAAQSVFQSLATELVSARNRRARHSLHNGRAVNNKSAIALRGIVLEALREGDYWVVLDHLQAPAAALSADVRDIMFYGNTRVLAVARSAHMEDLGFLRWIFVLRSERMPLPNFGRSEARQFAEERAQLAGLLAWNLSDFLDRIVDLSNGSPGAIVTMIKMALLPRYRIQGHIKISPLYIDSRLAWHAANAL
jgi:hypothetical protein